MKKKTVKTRLSDVDFNRLGHAWAHLEWALDGKTIFDPPVFRKHLDGALLHVKAVLFGQSP